MVGPGLALHPERGGVPGARTSGGRDKDVSGDVLVRVPTEGRRDRGKTTSSRMFAIGRVYRD